jgi:hypothetical protein
MLNKSITFLILLSMSFLIFSLESRGTTSINIISTSNVKMMPTSSFDIDIEDSEDITCAFIQFGEIDGNIQDVWVTEESPYNQDSEFELIDYWI